MLKDVIQRTSLNESEDILDAIDNSADCNVHGDVGVETIVPYSTKTNQNVTQKDNSNIHKDMLNGIMKHVIVRMSVMAMVLITMSVLQRYRQKPVIPCVIARKYL